MGWREEWLALFISTNVASLQNCSRFDWHGLLGGGGGGGGCLLAYLWCAEWHCDAVKIRFLCMCQCLVCSALAPFHPHSPTFYFFRSPWKSHMGGGGGEACSEFICMEISRGRFQIKNLQMGGGGGGLLSGGWQRECHSVIFCQSFIRSSTV